MNFKTSDEFPKFLPVCLESVQVFRSIAREHRENADKPNATSLNDKSNATSLSYKSKRQIDRSRLEPRMSAGEFHMCDRERALHIRTVSITCL